MSRNCEKFCNGQKETPFGLVAKGLDVSCFNGVLKRHPENGSYLCPMGFTSDPKDKDVAAKVIANGGRFSICHRNPWKWIMRDDH